MTRPTMVEDVGDKVTLHLEAVFQNVRRVAWRYLLFQAVTWCEVWINQAIPLTLIHHSLQILPVTRDIQLG